MMVLVAPTASSNASWSVVAVTILGSTVLATLVTTAVAGLRSSSAARREGYTAAVEAVVAWFEFPYRVRRRTSDTPDALGGLASVGHDLQQRLAGRLAWVAAENEVLSDVFDTVLDAVRPRVSTSLTEAWNTPALSAAREMNVSPFGPGDPRPELVSVHRAIAYRFGSRRLLPPWLIRRRLRKRGILPALPSRSPDE
jgi:hypothetical protein